MVIKIYPGFGDQELYEINIGGTPIFRGEDFFAELGVERTASKAKIIKAYRDLSKTNHPDKIPGADRNKWNRIEKAYNFLISGAGNVNNYKDNYLSERWWGKSMNEKDTDTGEYGKVMANYINAVKKIKENDEYLTNTLKGKWFDELRLRSVGKTIREINSYVEWLLEIRSNVMIIEEVKRKEEKLTKKQVSLNIVAKKFEGLSSKNEIKDKFDKLSKWIENTADRTAGITSKFKTRRALKKRLTGLDGWKDLSADEQEGFLNQADLYSRDGFDPDGKDTNHLIQKVKDRIAKTAGDSAEKTKIKQKQQVYLEQLRAKGGWNLLNNEEKAYLEEKITSLNDKASQDGLSTKALEYAQWFLRASWVRANFRTSLWDKLETLVGSSLGKEDITEDDGHGGRRKTGERYKEAKSFMNEPRPMNLDSKNLVNFKLFFYLIKDWGKDWNLIKTRLSYTYPKTTTTHPYQAEIDSAIAEIQDELDKEPKISLSELEPKYRNYPAKLKNFTLPTDILGFKNEVLADIQAKRAAKTDTSDPLTRYKGEAISAIDSALLLDPEVSLEELEATNRNFATQINGVDSKSSNAKDQIDAIKTKVLANIEQVRKTKQQHQDQTTLLANLRTEAINLIHQELKRKPALSESDISIANWKSELTNASQESKIIEIKDKVLAEIKNKRVALKEELEIKELIRQGKEANTFEALSEIISKLGKYSSSDVYKKHQSEIDQLETRLQSLNSSKYKEKTKKDLDQQIQQEGLSEKDLSQDPDTKAAVDLANRSGKSEDKKKAKTKISHLGAKVNLSKLIAKAKAALANNKISDLEKKQLAQEIQAFIGKDDYKKSAYQKEKSQVDSLLDQLRGETSHSQPTSPKSKWPKALGIGALVIIPLSLVGLVAVRYYRIKWQRQKGD
ncbi:MAG: molecular chaperone DnaJ [Mycoplasmataceae bacterium RC_NB112A]|nr:MAG: molecular chaperone DnaJ [Mycoplasmataceae bacterium RC_NB112A]